MKGIGEGDILADISFRGETKKIRLTNVMHIPSADGKILSLKVLDQRGFKSHIAGGQIHITKGTEVYAEASLGGELYEVKMKIVPAQETRANETRREQTQSKVGGADSTRPSEHICNKVLITRVTSDTPKIKIPKMNHEAKLEETYIGTCLHEEELMRDMHQETPKLHQHEHATISATSAPTFDKDSLQQIVDLKTCLDRFEKQVMKLQTEAKKNQSSDELEREKLNTAHTKHDTNPSNDMKNGSNDIELQGWHRDMRLAVAK